MTVGKASFQTNLETLNEFRKLVAAKYGRLYGVLNKEFTIALEKRIKELKQELENYARARNDLDRRTVFTSALKQGEN